MLNEPHHHIRPLAQPLFLRHNPHAKAGVLLVHGFGDVPYSMHDLAHHLYDEGYDVFLPRLPGHGSRIEHLARATAADWQYTVTRGVDQLRTRVDRVAIVGRSFGAVLAMLEALRAPQNIDALVVLAAPSSIRAQRPLEVFLPLISLFRKKLKKPWAKPEHRLQWLEVGRYDSFPVQTLREFFRTLRSIRDGRLSAITTPILFIHGRKDRLARPASVDFFLERLGSPVKEVLWVEEATHEAKSLHQHPDVQRRLLDFLGRYLHEG